MTTVIQCFSALVASNRGQKCNIIKNQMNQVLSSRDERTGLPLSIIFKYHKEDMPAVYDKISNIVANIMNPNFTRNDLKFFNQNIKHIKSNKKLLDGNNDYDISEFRAILEDSMNEGKWNGFVPLS
jgi:hypothetical protein